MIRSFVILFFLTIPLHLFSQNVSREEAISAANNHMDLYFHYDAGKLKSIEEYGTEDQSLLYAVNFDPGGWVLVSGNKATIPVIAFNMSGNFIMPQKKLNNAGYELISSYIQQIGILNNSKMLSQHPAWIDIETKNFKNDSKLGITIEPLINVEWNQGAGWNRFCPADEAGPNGHVYVGCVAVSMAQALSVFSKPSQGEDSHSYSHPEYGLLTAHFGSTFYDWNSMDSITSDDNNALILYHCAISVDMDFGPDGSGTMTSYAGRALGDYFRMSKLIEYKRRSNFEEEWTNILIEELLCGRPVIYKGDADDGNEGHAFNIDGIINSQYFHINWGWGGEHNGYFIIDDLSPGINDFSENNAVLVGIQPYHFPTEVLLSDYLVPKEVIPGAAIGEISIVDEADDNEYQLILLTDSSYINNEWVMNYYIDGDTLRTGVLFPDEITELDTIVFHVSDIHNNYIESEVVLLFEDTVVVSIRNNPDSINDFRFFPNPAKDYINIESGPDSWVEAINIYSMQGQLIANHLLLSNNKRIDVSGLSKGLYILEAIFTDANAVRKKIVIQ